MTFKDGKFEFYTAHYGSWARDMRIVFRVRNDTTAKNRALEKSIEFYDRLLPSTETEIKSWLNSHNDYKEVIC